VTPNDDERRGLVAVTSCNAASSSSGARPRGIVASCREGNVRDSRHFYNNEADIDRFLHVL
jgi:selenocysteine lyase/cysteine desulfurase